jgi:L-threonylcarbamoyladenylate synthase
MTESPPKTQADPITEALALLQAGDVIGLPTETVYGLAADARQRFAVEKIFALKGRPSNHPVIVHLHSAEQIRAWAIDIPDLAWQLAEQFWPGPMTLILKRAPGVIDEITGGQDSVGLRIPSHPVARALLEQFGDGLAAPSANRFGRISPTRAEHVRAEFGRAVPCVLDGGASEIGLESTIIDVRSGRPSILRPGAISAEQVQEFSGALQARAGADAAGLRVSGNLESHYAPNARVRLVDRDELAARPTSVAGLSLGPLPGHRFGIALQANAVQYGQALYAAMRALDASGPESIWIETPPAAPEWTAVLDRLQRAAGPR